MVNIRLRIKCLTIVTFESSRLSDSDIVMSIAVALSSKYLDLNTFWTRGSADFAN